MVFIEYLLRAKHYDTDARNEKVRLSLYGFDSRLVKLDSLSQWMFPSKTSVSWIYSLIVQYLSHFTYSANIYSYNTYIIICFYLLRCEQLKVNSCVWFSTVILNAQNSAGHLEKPQRLWRELKSHTYKSVTWILGFQMSSTEIRK